MIRNRLFNFQFWPQFLTALIVVLAIAGYRYNTYYDTHSADAFVAGAITHLSALVPGSVARVYVETNQSIKQGDKLIELDKSPYLYELELAKAQYNLVKNKQSSSENELGAAKAVLDLAQYHYDNTTLLAPTDGIVGEIRVLPGQYLSPGDRVLVIIKHQSYWIEALYRETAIRLIKPGDKAKIRLSMYPGVEFSGHVERIYWAAGASDDFSLPTQSAQNWIKIAKRFPVHIRVDAADPAYPLHLGASATTTIYRP
ncbi:hemolysin D [Legionella sainthelensi]|uniref:HlyD family secretion protein n=1 Tax=Legionella sainthelensi TaxID=28087 RepID=A0A2H5FPK4_9GAMM|nr:efflux RND transporter periplasmic adaptor subunit [Legionella sainthelensi]AUH73504.1 HlyD family secretion protein [Legionella sainthelensi]VEB37018.1 hemolysin D [Legionella sainthelensi]